MLKIKKDAVIYPYGKSSGSFTSETELSQDILEHLQTRFPDDIENTKKKKEADLVDVVVTAETLEANPDLVEEGVLEGDFIQIDPIEPEEFDVEVSTSEEPIIEIKSLEVEKQAEVKAPVKRTRKAK